MFVALLCFKRITLHFIRWCNRYTFCELLSFQLEFNICSWCSHFCLQHSLYRRCSYSRFFFLLILNGILLCRRWNSSGKHQFLVVVVVEKLAPNNVWNGIKYRRIVFFPPFNRPRRTFGMLSHNVSDFNRRCSYVLKWQEKWENIKIHSTKIPN